MLSGSKETLTECLASVVKSKSFCTYPDESEKRKDAKLHVEHIAPHHELLHALHGLQPNLSFAKNQLREALLDINKDKKYVKDAHTDDWVTTMVLRVGNLCRVVSQSEMKPSKARWVQELPWAKGSGEVNKKKSSQKRI